MNFPFALWLIGLETGMGKISANKVNGIFSQVLLEKVFLLKKKNTTNPLLLQDVVVFCM